MVKLRLAPVKTMTLPRLELNAAVTAVRLMNQVIREIDLPIVSTWLWSDSTLTLQYIKIERQRFKTYVANRVTEIRESTQPDYWLFISGEENPADILTSGVSKIEDLMKPNGKRGTWINGPPLLVKILGLKKRFQLFPLIMTK